MQQLLPLYECTLPVATLFRPVLLKAAAALVDAAVSGSAAAVQPSAELAVALLTVLELAPQTEGCVGCAAVAAVISPLPWSCGGWSRAVHHACP